MSVLDADVTAAEASAAAAVDEAPERLLRRLWRSGGGRAGLLLVGLVFALAFAGPLFAPHAETDVVGRPYEPPSGSLPLGTDFLGHDLLSRLLAGGNTVVLLSVAATVLPYLICVPIGMLLGYRGGRVAGAAMRGVDVLLAFPALIFVLMLLSGLGTALWVIVLGITIITMPRVIRIVRAVAEELSVRGFVEAAELRGDSSLRIVMREILPNIWTPILADLGVRFAGTAALVASLSFLGFGLQPPGADWGVMIYENRSGLTIAPLGVFAPAACIGAFMVGANLLGDAIAQLAGRVVDVRDRYT